MSSFDRPYMTCNLCATPLEPGHEKVHTYLAGATPGDERLGFIRVDSLLCGRRAVLVTCAGSACLEEVP